MSKHNKDRRKAAKMARGRCPICGKTCRVAADGRSGHCETQKKSWRIEKVDPKGIGPGRVRHPELPRLLLDMIRWNHRVVGRYLHPTLEQWELGFMRDEDVVAEVAHWNRVAFAFIDFHHRRNLPLRPDEEELPCSGPSVPSGSGPSPRGCRPTTWPWSGRAGVSPPASPRTSSG